MTYDLHSQNFHGTYSLLSNAFYSGNACRNIKVIPYNIVQKLRMYEVDDVV